MMKTILLLIALIGFTAGNTYSQTKSCSCKKKTVHHKTTTTRQTTASRLRYPAKRDLAGASNIARINNELETENATCHRYRKHNIVVTECPGIMYDEAGNVQYSTERSYTGSYPQTDEKPYKVITGPRAPQHTTISHQRGEAPADGNQCADCSAQ
jgi:hypothetical protein